MSVNSKIFRIVYHTDPNFSEYRYPFKIFTEKGLRVSLVDPGDREQAPMILGVDYEVTGVGEADGGLVRLTLAGLHKAEKGLKMVVKKGVAHQAHGDQAAIEALNAHKVDETAHAALFEKQEEALSAHKVDETAHAALFEKQEEALSAHNDEETAHAALFSKQAALFDAKIRRRLTGPLNLYVHLDGDDKNDGSAEYPFRSIYGAYRYWRSNIDTNGYKTTVNVAPGRYAPYGRQVITTGSPDEFRIQGLEKNNPPEISGLVFFFSPNVTIGDLIIECTDLGDCLWSHAYSGLVVNGPVTLRGDAKNVGLLRSENYSDLAIRGAAVTFENTIGLAAMCRFNGRIVYDHSAGTELLGKNTGKRYDINYGLSTIHVFGRGPNAFPGTVAGTDNPSIGCYYI